MDEVYLIHYIKECRVWAYWYYKWCT